MKYQALDEHLRLNGVWIQTHANEDGIDFSTADKSIGSISEFNSGVFEVHAADGECLLKGTYRINPNAVPPEIDWADTEGDDAGKTFRSIYKLTSSTFMFCAADVGMARPSSFEPRSGHTIRKFLRKTASN